MGNNQWSLCSVRDDPVDLCMDWPRTKSQEYLSGILYIYHRNLVPRTWNQVEISCTELAAVDRNDGGPLLFD